MAMSEARFTQHRQHMALCPVASQMAGLGSFPHRHQHLQQAHDWGHLAWHLAPSHPWQRAIALPVAWQGQGARGRPLAETPTTATGPRLWASSALPYVLVNIIIIATCSHHHHDHAHHHQHFHISIIIVHHGRVHHQHCHMYPSLPSALPYISHHCAPSLYSSSALPCAVMLMGFLAHLIATIAIDIAILSATIFSSSIIVTFLTAIIAQTPTLAAGPQLCALRLTLGSSALPCSGHPQ